MLTSRELTTRSLVPVGQLLIVTLEASLGKDARGRDKISS